MNKISTMHPFLSFLFFLYGISTDERNQRWLLKHSILSPWTKCLAWMWMSVNLKWYRPYHLCNTSTACSSFIAIFAKLDTVLTSSISFLLFWSSSSFLDLVSRQARPFRFFFYYFLFVNPFLERKRIMFLWRRHISLEVVLSIAQLMKNKGNWLVRDDVAIPWFDFRCICRSR